MTPEDYYLDPSPLNEGPLSLYRIARTKYANLSGAGAAVAPGRWNRKGEPAIYTSIHRATCVLELLAHTTKSFIPKNLSLMVIGLDLWYKQEREGTNFEIRNADFVVYESLRAANVNVAERQVHASWSHDVGPLALGTPSVIVPEWSVVLFPEHPDFWKRVKLISIEPFEYDPRLFPEGAPTEKTGVS